MKIAYLLSHYPTLAHTYLLREVRGLRAQGIDVHVASIRRHGLDEASLPPEEREEAQRTFYILGSGAPALIAALLRTAVSRPAPFLRGLARAISMGAWNPRKTVYSLAYFVEAVSAGTWMLRNGISHFHTHYATTPGLLLVTVFPITMSMTIHGYEEFIDPYGKFLPEKIAACRFACAISRFARSQMIYIVPYEMWDRIDVSPLGINVATYAPVPFRESPQPFEIICVGRLTAVKAHQVLLGAVERLVRSGRNVRLRLVGGGEEQPAIERRIADLGIGDHVILDGWKTQSEVRELYSRSDAFALASCAEGVPVVLMEAMAMRIPCVATRITGIPELIRDGVEGLLVTPSDEEEMAAAIARLYDDAELRLRVAEAGRQKIITHYNLEMNVERLAGIFSRRLAS